MTAPIQPALESTPCRCDRPRPWLDDADGLGCAMCGRALPFPNVDEIARALTAEKHRRRMGAS